LGAPANKHFLRVVSSFNSLILILQRFDVLDEMATDPLEVVLELNIRDTEGMLELNIRDTESSHSSVLNKTRLLSIQITSLKVVCDFGRASSRRGLASAPTLLRTTLSQPRLGPLSSRNFFVRNPFF